MRFLKHTLNKGFVNTLLRSACGARFRSTRKRQSWRSMLMWRICKPGVTPGAKKYAPPGEEDGGRHFGRLMLGRRMNTPSHRSGLWEAGGGRSEFVKLYKARPVQRMEYRPVDMPMSLNLAFRSLLSLDAGFAVFPPAG